MKNRIKMTVHLKFFIQHLQKKKGLIFCYDLFCMNNCSLDRFGTVIFLTVTFVPRGLDVTHSQLIRNVQEPANIGWLTAVSAFANMLK